MTDGRNVLAFVLAGGNGTRLHPLTADDCKPALPFGHSHRVVDFVLANLANSRVGAVDLLVQYRPRTLVEHVRRAWRASPVRVAAPADDACFRGTADAVRQNLQRLDELRPDLVAVFGADHVYRMDVRQMIDFHVARGADATVATLPVPLAQAGGFGITEVDADRRVRAFREKPKPADAPAIPGRPGMALASMGNYVFSADVLRRALRDAYLRGESDFGSHVLPRLLQRHRLVAYDFHANRVPGAGVGAGEERGYWRDIGTVGAYFDAHLDTLGAAPRFRIANPARPLPQAGSGEQPAEIDGGDVRRSSVGAESFVDRALLDRSVVGRSVEIQRGARLDQCIVLPRSIVGAGARLRRVIVAEGNVIPDGEVIGYDAARDAARFHVGADGIVVVPRGRFGGRGAAPVEREAALLD